MIERPKLPDRIRRLHVLRWNQLIERSSFTGEHLEWHTSPKRRRAAARPTFSLIPPPPGSGVKHYGENGEVVSYQKWHQYQMEAWTARQNDPAIIDSIGVIETIVVGAARFSDVTCDYLPLWATTSGADSDSFCNWIEEACREIETDVERLMATR